MIDGDDRGAAPGDSGFVALPGHRVLRRLSWSSRSSVYLLRVEPSAGPSQGPDAREPRLRALKVYGPAVADAIVDAEWSALTLLSEAKSAVAPRVEGLVSTAAGPGVLLDYRAGVPLARILTAPGHATPASADGRRWPGILAILAVELAAVHRLGLAHGALRAGAVHLVAAAVAPSSGVEGVTVFEAPAARETGAGVVIFGWGDRRAASGAGALSERQREHWLEGEACRADWRAFAALLDGARAAESRAAAQGALDSGRGGPRAGQEADWDRAALLAGRLGGAGTSVRSRDRARLVDELSRALESEARLSPGLTASPAVEGETPEAERDRPGFAVEPLVFEESAPKSLRDGRAEGLREQQTRRPGAVIALAERVLSPELSEILERSLTGLRVGAGALFHGRRRGLVLLGAIAAAAMTVAGLLLLPSKESGAGAGAESVLGVDGGSSESSGSAEGETGATPGEAASDSSAVPGTAVDVTLGGDPLAAVVVLLERRATCFREQSLLCLDDVVQAGSPLSVADRLRLDDGPGKPLILAPPELAQLTLMERLGDAAVIGYATETEAGRLWLMAGENGWRLREIMDLPEPPE